MESFALIPSKGLGDLIVTIGIAYNLSKTYKVTIFHPLISQLASLFPFVQAMDRPCNTHDFDPSKFDFCLLIYEDSPFFDTFHPFLKQAFGNRLFTLNPVVTKKADYRFCDEYFFDSSKSFSSNLNIFANKTLKLDCEDKKGGFKHTSLKDPRLVVMHVTASKLSKSWPSSRFKRLKKSLEKKGYTVIFATLPHEQYAIGQGLYSGLKNLKELAETLEKASLLIANESGVAHLASYLHTPSIVLCRNQRIQKFWGADYEGICHPLFPSTLIPNLKGMRFRDKYWKYCIFTHRVKKQALELLTKKPLV